MDKVIAVRTLHFPAAHCPEHHRASASLCFTVPHASQLSGTCTGSCLWCKRKHDWSDLATFSYCSVVQFWCSCAHCTVDTLGCGQASLGLVRPKPNGCTASFTTNRKTFRSTLFNQKGLFLVVFQIQLYSVSLFFLQKCQTNLLLKGLWK